MSLPNAPGVGVLPEQDVPPGRAVPAATSRDVNKRLVPRPVEADRRELDEARRGWEVIVEERPTVDAAAAPEHLRELAAVEQHQRGRQRLKRPEPLRLAVLYAVVCERLRIDPVEARPTVLVRAEIDRRGRDDESPPRFVAPELLYENGRVNFRLVTPFAARGPCGRVETAHGAPGRGGGDVGSGHEPVGEFRFEGRERADEPDGREAEQEGRGCCCCA